jgi:hypothetical protein
LEPKIKITSCEYESGKSRLKIQANSIPDGCLVTFEGSDPSPAFIINSDGSRNVAFRVPCKNAEVFDIEMSSINGGESVPVFATFLYDEETAMAADVFIKENSTQGSGVLSVIPSFVGADENVTFSFKGKPGEKVEFHVSEKKFAAEAKRDGVASITVPSSFVFSSNVFNGRSISRFKINAFSPSSGDGEAIVNVVPKNMFALAAVEDVNRPSCVIMDPVSSPSFSLSADTYPRRCFDEPLISRALNSRGEESSLLEGYSSFWKNCDNAYASIMDAAIDSDCRIQENWKVVSLNDKTINLVDDVDGLVSVDGDWAAVWAACDPDPTSGGTVFDPCNISGDVLSKIPRIFVAVGQSAVALDVIKTARMSIKKSPSYYHSAFLNNPTTGKVASVIVRMENGNQISKTVNASDDYYATLNSLKNELLNDANIVSYGINISINGTGSSTRLDFGSDNRFTIKAGSTSASVAENSLRVTLNSNYVLQGELTYPVDVMSGITDATHVIMLDGPFRGLLFPFYINGSSISIDACPRVNTIGSFRVDQDYSCMHVALIRSLSRVFIEPNVVKLPFLTGEGGNVLPASAPSISEDGSIVCSGVDGASTYIYYHNGINIAEPWTRISSKEFDFPKVVSDSSKYEDCIVCENSFNEETQLHACYVGAASAPRVHSHLSSFWNHLSSSPDWSRYVTAINVDGYNPIASATNASIILRDSIVNLRKGVFASQQVVVIYESLIPAPSASAADLFISRYESDTNPYASTLSPSPFAQGKMLASVLIQIDPSSATNYNINLSFNGKIAKIFASSADLARTDDFFGLANIPGYQSYNTGIHPVNNPGTSTRVTSYSLNVGADLKSLSLSLSVTGSGMCRVRILIEPEISEITSPAIWNRMVSGDSLVSVPSSGNVVMELTPDGSECAAIASLCQDENGNYFDGNFDQINYGIDTYVNIEDITSFQNESSLIDSSTTLNITELEPSAIITSISASSGSGDTDINRWRYAVEFIGSALSSRPGFYPADYRRGSVPIFSASSPTLPGINAGDLCSVLLFDIKATSASTGNITGTVTFNSPIAYLEVKRNSTNLENPLLYSDPEYASSVSGNLTVARNAQAPITSTNGAISFTISPDRKLLSFSVAKPPLNATVRYGFRVYVSNQNDLILGPKSANDVDKEINKILSRYAKVNNAYQVFIGNSLNKLLASRSGFRYDSCVPLISSCRFDDLNVNPNADVPISIDQTGQLNLDASDTEYAIVTDISSTAAADVYSQNTPFRMGGSKSNMLSWGVVLLLEKETLILTNTESPSEFALSNNLPSGSVDGYIESKVHEIFTGKAKLAVVCNPRPSKGMDGSIGALENVVSFGDPFLVQGGFRLSLTSAMVKMAAECYDYSVKRDKIITSVEDPSYDVPNFSSLILCAVNGVPHVSAHIVHDEPSKRRQVDIAFGNPYGENPLHPFNVQMPIPFRSGRRYSLSFSSIYLGAPFMRFSSEVNVNTFDLNMNTIFTPSPSASLYLQNGSFESAFADPGDFIHLENDNQYIEGVTIVGGGACYSGSYMVPANGSRSIILESNIGTNFQFNIANPEYPNFTFIKNRRSRCSSGVGGGIKFSSNLPARPSLMECSIGMRNSINNAVSVKSRVVMMSAGNQASSYRISDRFGTFTFGSRPDFIRSRLLFDATGSSMNFYINNLDIDMHKIFAFSNSNTSGNAIVDYASDYTSLFYYISSDGNLMRAYMPVSLNQWGFDPCSRQQTALIAANVTKVSSRGSAAADATGQGSYVVYLKSNGSLGHYGENIDFSLNTGNFVLPVGNDFVDVAAGLEFGLALRKNGQIEAWGSDASITGNVPSGNFVSIDCGAHFACALSEDGSISCWGDNTYNQCDSPSGIFVKIRCGWDSSVALDAEGSATMWGKDPVGGSWSVPSYKFRDVHIGGGPIARIYPSDVQTAVGVANVPAGGNDPANLHDPNVIHSGEISRFATGITVDGDIITWGDDSPLTVNDSDNASSLDDLLLYLEFSDIPDKKAVSVFCGPQGACIISEDGFLIGFGSGQVPYFDGATRFISYYASEFCVHKGGVVIDSVSLAPEYMLFDESENPPKWAQMGYASEYEWQLTRGVSASNGVSSIPITLTGEGVNRNASVASRDGRVHIAFESTRDKQNSICYTSSYPSVNRFKKAIRLTEGAIDRNNPSIGVDLEDRKLVAWRERINNTERISCATSVEYSDPDADICFVDSCVLALKQYQNSDPYYLASVQECEIVENFTFPRSATGVYFNVEMYSDQQLKNRVAIYSSLDMPDNFMISGEYITSEGISVLPLQSYEFRFFAPDDPSILGGPLWYRVAARSFANDFGSPDIQSDYLIFKSTGTIVDGTADDFAAGFDDTAGEIYVVFEGVQRYNFNIDPQNKNQFDFAANVPSRDTGLFLPSNYLTLPGVPSQIRAMSYTIHVKNNSAAHVSGEQYSGKVTFSSPIAAIIFNGDELVRTTGIATGNAIYPSAADRGTTFAAGTKFVLSPDGKTIHMNFVAKNPAGRDSGFAVQQLRILTIETSALESQQYGVFGCDKIRNSSCGVQFKYVNLLGNNSSALSRVHFRAVVYSSSDVDDVVATFTSVTHPHLWSNGMELFPTEGIAMLKNDSVGIGFYPNMINASSAMSSFDESDSIKRLLSNGNPYYDIIRENLFFDISYRIRIDAISTVDPTGTPTVVQTERVSEQFLLCSENSNWKNSDFSVEDWNSSGSGVSDTVISESSICGNPSIGVGRKTFYIGFEKYADTDSSGQLPSCPDICMAVWDAEENRFDSSAQGGKDRVINIGHSESNAQIKQYRMPHVVVDDMSNFAIFALEQRDDGSSIGISNGSVGYQRKPEIVYNVEDLRPCSFSDSLGERFAAGDDPPSYMKVRVYENDIISFSPNGSSSPRPVVASSLISLDIIGAPGTYAVRIKNDDTSDFSPWIPIGGDVPVLPLDAIDTSDYREFQNIFRGRYISRDRFIMPWMLASGSGVKTVCVEALTFFGKTNSFCTDVICEPKMPDYSIDFYAQSGSTRIPLSKYKGYPVASPFAFAIDKPQISDDDLRSIEESQRIKIDSIYIEVEFKNYSLIEKLVNLGSLNFFKNRLIGRSSVNATVIYRGVQQVEIDLQQDADKKNMFYGSFALKRSDGLLRQDGIGLVKIDIPILGIGANNVNFVRQIQEMLGQSPNISMAEISRNNSINMPPIDEDAVARAFGNSEYYS